MEKFLRYIKICGYEVTDIAQEVEISVTEFNNILLSMDFTQEQLRKMIIFLNMSESEYMNIFFEE